MRRGAPTDRALLVDRGQVIPPWSAFGAHWGTAADL